MEGFFGGSLRLLVIVLMFNVLQHTVQQVPGVHGMCVELHCLHSGAGDCRVRIRCRVALWRRSCAAGPSSEQVSVAGQLGFSKPLHCSRSELAAYGL
jgi:hypothetical protein